MKRQGLLAFMIQIKFSLEPLTNLIQIDWLLMMRIIPISALNYVKQQGQVADRLHHDTTVSCLQMSLACDIGDLGVTRPMISILCTDGSECRRHILYGIVAQLEVQIRYMILFSPKFTRLVHSDGLALMSSRLSHPLSVSVCRDGVWLSHYALLVLAHFAEENIPFLYKPEWNVPWRYGVKSPQQEELTAIVDMMASHTSSVAEQLVGQLPEQLPDNV